MTPEGLSEPYDFVIPVLNSIKKNLVIPFFPNPSLFTLLLLFCFSRLERETSFHKQ